MNMEKYISVIEKHLDPILLLDYTHLCELFLQDDYIGLRADMSDIITSYDMKYDDGYKYFTVSSPDDSLILSISHIERTHLDPRLRNSSRTFSLFNYNSNPNTHYTIYDLRHKCISKSFKIEDEYKSVDELQEKWFELSLTTDPINIHQYMIIYVFKYLIFKNNIKISPELKLLLANQNYTELEKEIMEI